jgi:APA family basic amino acid/polyamine antiporter
MIEGKKGSLFICKPIEDIHDDLENGPRMKQVLGAWGLISLGLGCVIGAGIFVITGQAAASYAGPAIAISFVISAIACALAGLCYAEFAAAIPVSGSAYSYSYATLGEFLAWFIGWDLMLEYLFAASTVAVGWSGYVTSFLKDIGIHIPAALSSAPLAHTAEKGWHLTGALLNFPAAFVVAICSLLLFRGIHESTRVNNLIVVVKLIVLFLLVAFGLAHVNLANWQPFIPPNTGTFGEYGWSGILRGSAVVFFAYVGFDAVSTAAQETKNPQRNMPIGIIGSLVISTLVYIAVALVITGIVPFKLLGVPDPIAVAVNYAPALSWLRPIVKLGAIAGLTSVILVSLMGQTRVFFAMSRDGLLPPLFSHLHAKHHTPHVTTLVTGIVACLIAGLFPIDILGELVSIGTLLAFAIVCGSILVLRKTRPDMPRPFKTPWVPVVPILGMVAAIGQMVFLPLDTWFRLLIWMGLGMVIYFTYSIHHSKVRQRT